VQLASIEIVCTPARHASGRTLFDKDATLWAGYALLGAKHRVYYSGDTGLFNGLRDIGQRFGPFDVAMIEVGQYHQAWPDWHIGPEQAVLASRWLRGRVMLPVHWGLLALAYHNWTEPIERVLAEAERSSVTVVTPKPGQSFEPDREAHFERWWPNVPWKTAAEDPIRSTSVQR
jgi:L-ascorbate metabolism protein UlaG (beta-lactamase superfamily)